MPQGFDTMTDHWKRTENPPPGLQHFTRWFAPEGVPTWFRPADIDGIWHDKRENRFLMIEFKPDDMAVTTGQRITLEGFSKLPGCTSLLIADTRWDDYTGTPVPQDEAVTITVWIDNVSRVHTTTFEKLNEAMTLWYQNTGPLVKHTEIPPPAPQRVLPEFMLPGPTTRQEALFGKA